MPETNYPSDELSRLSAGELLALMKRCRVSCRKVMEHFLDRIARINPLINAICLLRPADELLREARAADRQLEGNPCNRLPSDSP